MTVTLAHTRCCHGCCGCYLLLHMLHVLCPAAGAALPLPLPLLLLLVPQNCC
jgi:hypothetical protein